MAQYEVNAPDGKVYTVNAPEGATHEDAIKYVQTNLYKPAALEAGKSLNTGLSDVPRQIGLTARYGLEGAGQAAQIFTEPVAGLMRAAGVKTKSLGDIASGLADTIGLPSPQGANERVIGDATRLVSGAGGMGSAAKLAGKVPGLLGDAAAWLAANPAQQLSSAAGAGLAGGASREAGGNSWLQAGASLLGGVGGGLAPGAVNGLLGAFKNVVTPKLNPQQIDIKLSNIFNDMGKDYSVLPEQARVALRSELGAALQAGKQTDPVAVSRLADFAAVGATPTRGMVSQNPVQITREMNLAKMAANSSDDQLHGLPLLQNQNNTALINKLNELGGRSETLPITAGRLVGDRVAGTRDSLRSAEQSAWDAAKASPGYKQPIYPDGLNAINKELGETGMMAFMAKPITSYMEAFQTGQQPFTPQAYRNLQSMLAGEMSKGGNEAAAAKIARKALEATPMQPITNPRGIDFGQLPVTSEMAARMRASDAQPGDAMGLIDKARAATRQAYAYEDSSPLVRSTLADARSADPEKIAKSFILNGTVNDAQAVAQQVGPKGIPVIRDAIANYIKKQALSGAADETGKISQSRLNGVMRNIGDEKLSVFFSPEEIAQLKATARVASLMQSQPIGSAVNNSNSGALLLGRGLDVLKGVTNKIPFGQAALIDPLRNINISIQQRRAQNLLPGLLAEQQKQSKLQPLLLPGLLAGGGLLSP